MAVDKVFSMADVASHKNRNDLWVIIHGKGNTRQHYVHWKVDT